MSRVDVRITNELFDPWKLQADMAADVSGSGAMAAFVGSMRDHNAGRRVTAMTLEHYSGMTEATLRAMAREAIARFSLHAVRIVHRVGAVRPSEPLVLVAVTAAHRGEAFSGCEFLMDLVKTRAPFWKKEETEHGAHWVEARDTDYDAAARWLQPGATT